MGVILDSRGMPADGTQPDPYVFNQISSEVSDKGFLSPDRGSVERGPARCGG
jgi:hypothetical protein